MEHDYLNELRVDEDTLMKQDYRIRDPDTIPTPPSIFLKSRQ
jgi:hypothetical protein